MRIVIVALALLVWSLAATAAEPRQQQIQNTPNCTVYSVDPQPDETMTWSGACADGEANGKGTLVQRYSANGEAKEQRYTGAIRNGNYHGQGAFTWSNGNRYDGNVVDGEWTGHGIFAWPNGNQYEGAFVDGEQTGRGVFTWPNGTRYEGDFVDGERTGHGISIFANGDSKCEGDWREDQLLGIGKGWQNGTAKKCYMDGSAITYSE
jgi:hypothetical protein